MRKEAKRLIWNAVFLTASTLFMRTVGVGFQVYLAGRAGAEVMGLFSLLGGVYGFSLTLAISGVHLGVTHLVVEAIGKNEEGRVKRVMRKATLYSLFFGTLAALLLVLLAPTIGTLWLKDERTIDALRLMGLTLPLIALSSAFSGYFSAVRRVYKNALTQIAEQALKIGFTVYLLAFFFAKDAKSALLSLVLGGLLAESFSFLIELSLYLFDRKKHYPKTTPAAGDGQRLLAISLPVAFSTYIRSGLLTIEHILIPEGLRNSGASHVAALSAYGSIQSMALPVVLYPAALISSFAGLLIPEFSESRVKGHTRHIDYMFGRVFSLSAAFAIGASGVLLFCSEELGTLLYPGTDAARYIRLLAPLIPVMYLDTATDAMLKGLGQQVYSMNVNIADAALSVLLVKLLIPRLGITGYLVTIYISELFNTTMSLFRLLSISRAKIKVFRWIYKPLFCVLGATSLVRLLFLFLPAKSNLFGMVLRLTLTALFYLVLLRFFGGFDKEDRAWLLSLFTREEKSPAKPICRFAELKSSKKKFS